MASSRNRFAVLGEGSSSSKEQEIPVPVIGTEGKANRTMQDTGQVDSPISSVDPEGSITRQLNIKEGLILFHKKRAQILAEEEAERVEKSRQKSKQSPSAIPPRGVRKRSASDEAEERLKRQRIGSLSRRQTAQEVPVTVPTNESNGETEEPNDGREQTSTSAIVVQEDPYLSPPSSFAWRNIRIPRDPLLCIVQVNNSIRIGSFDKNTTDWAFKLTFNAGQGVVPTMIMKFFSNGIGEPQSAQTGWCLGEWLVNDWMVTDFKVHRVTDCAENGRIRHSDVLGLCKTDEEKARLICISLEAWPKILGHFDRNNQWKNPQPGVKRLFSTVFTGRRPYHMRIWFIAPGNLENFERQCLSIFTLFFQQRKPPHYGIVDANGVGFDI